MPGGQAGKGRSGSVGIDERVQYIIDKAVRNGHPEAEPRILEKKEELKEVFVREIEVEIHMTVDELMKYGYAEFGRSE